MKFVLSIVLASMMIISEAAAAAQLTALQTRIQFFNGSDRLAGVLTTPGTPGRHPAILFIYRSSGADHSGYGLYPILAKRFAELGVTTLSWDKPGIGSSTGDWTKQNWLAGDRALEALSAIRYLKSRPDTDASHIGVWDISQGGWVVLQLLQMTRDVAFVIDVSAPAGTVWDQTNYITRAYLRNRGLPAASVREAGAALRRIERFLREGASYDVYRQFVARYKDRDWFHVCSGIGQGDYYRLDSQEFDEERVFAWLDRPAKLDAMRVPVLFVYGAEDQNVDPLLSVQLYKRSASIRHARASFVVIPRMDHFVRLPPNRLASGKHYRQQPIAEDAITAMTVWLAAYLRPAAH